MEHGSQAGSKLAHFIRDRPQTWREPEFRSREPDGEGKVLSNEVTQLLGGMTLERTRVAMELTTARRW